MSLNTIGNNRVTNTSRVGIGNFFNRILVSTALAGIAFSSFACAKKPRQLDSEPPVVKFASGAVVRNDFQGQKIIQTSITVEDPNIDLSSCRVKVNGEECTLVSVSRHGTPAHKYAYLYHITDQKSIDKNGGKALVEVTASDSTGNTSKVTKEFSLK